jgi:hypothetical protein
MLSLLEDLVFLLLHLPIFPLHLVESKPPLPLAYINPATLRTHDVGKGESAFYSKPIPRPNIWQYMTEPLE